MALLRKIYWTVRHFLQDHFPRYFVDRGWLKWKGYKVDWNNPRDINEKIQWLMCCSDTSMWTLCSDKYKVRDYVKSKGLGDILVPLLGVWKRVEDIDFESLPDKFVIKCNHDSGSTHIVDKSKGFNDAALRADLKKCLKRKYGYYNGELYYNDIKPLVIAESFVPPDDNSLTSLPVDYKIWCFDGKPYSIWACYGRTSSETYVNLYDLDWNVHPEASVFTGHYKDGEGKVPKPECLDEMLDAAHRLSEGFPEVRADFYISGGKLFFSELTFASFFGKMDFYTDEYLKELGAQCVLPHKKR